MSTILTFAILGLSAYFGWCTAVAIKRVVTKKLEEKKAKENKDVEI